MRRRLPALLGMLALLAAGCAPVTAQMQRPPPPPPPPGLVPSTADPLHAALAAAAAAFADRGAALAGQPAAAAQAVAQLEYLTLSLDTDARYERLVAGVGRELMLAREEVRNALGVPPDASAQSVMQTLVAVAADLRAGREAAAAAAMTPPTFRPGGAESVARLGELGPLPQAANATAAAREAVATVDALGSGGSTQMVETGLPIGPHTANFEGAISSVGY